MNINTFKVHTVIGLIRKEEFNMDAKRAQEIADSSTMGNVLYNGTKIYIEHVDQQNGVATIHDLNNPSYKQSVSVSSLSEQ
jgi:small acid-soluble spore protein H (minor)